MFQASWKKLTRRFATACPAYYADMLSTVNIQVDALENWRETRSITSNDIFHLNSTRGWPGRGRFSFRYLVRSFLFDVVSVEQQSFQGIHIVFYFRALTNCPTKGLHQIGWFNKNWNRTVRRNYLLNDQDIRKNDTSLSRRNICASANSHNGYGKDHDRTEKVKPNAQPALVRHRKPVGTSIHLWAQVFRRVSWERIPVFKINAIGVFILETFRLAICANGSQTGDWLGKVTI